ncbi:helix-turn-helix transcriptional regulator [Litoreibacter ponti]|uniref:helix-turn-helix transcriptional regulator n=1 Tax=Litoreibacter ponti TaxID=1510457 RepID=UPI001304B992|nr:LuxR C-terminal-related transcriptional regulator [Litoreibacter ponti]
MLPFIREIEEAEAVPQAWELFQRGLRSLGFEFFIYVTVEPDFSGAFCLSNLPDLFSAAPPDRDPFLRYCCDHYDFTYTGADYLEDYDYLPDDARSFISQARSLGFRTGYGVPVRLRGEARFGGFNIGTGLPKERFEAQMGVLQHEIRFFCLITHRKIEELARALSTSEPLKFRGLIAASETEASKLLSAREREVVYHIGQGLSRKECASILGLSPNTVSDYLKSAYRKLGVRNRVSAAQKLRG